MKGMCLSPPAFSTRPTCGAAPRNVCASPAGGKPADISWPSAAADTQLPERRRADGGTLIAHLPGHNLEPWTTAQRFVAASKDREGRRRLTIEFSEWNL